MKALENMNDAKYHLMLGTLAFAIYFTDLMVPLGVALGALYITVVLFSLVSRKKEITYIWAIGCTFLTVGGFYASPAGGDLWQVVSNRLLAIYSIWVVAIVTLAAQSRVKSFVSLKADLKLAEFRSTLGEVAEYAKDAIIITDGNGQVIWVNRGFTELSGYPLDEIYGLKPGDILQGKQTNLDEVQRISAAVKNRDSVSAELVNYHKDGSPYWIDMSITPVEENGEVVRYVAVERDITRRKLLETELERNMTQSRKSTDTKSHFMKLMMHDVRRPIETIKRSTQLLSSQLHEESSKSLAHEVDRSCSMIDATVANITSLANINIEQLETKKDSINSEQLFTDLEDKITQLAQSQAIPLSIDTQIGTQAEFKGDEGLIQNVFYFFVLHSMTQSNSSEISISLRQVESGRGGQLLLELSSEDSGNSYRQMKQACASDLLDNQQGVASATFGYHFAHELTSKLGGSISVDLIQDRITQLSISIPVDKVIKEQPLTTNHSDNRVLIAEDNRVNAIVLTKLLNSIGFHDVDHAQNGAEAVEFARQQSYAVILMDNHMPEMSGVEATRVIIEEVGANNHIIACTADVSPDAKQEFLKHGAKAVIYKPLNKEILQQALDFTLNQPKMVSGSQA
ncbi:response regulator [uncultured Vibrio sp.]|uniref:response regulator n=1 Tax=uncultured Vibrio sp. TaxID=114054 RepID=UPI000911D48D|nr:response regulator [uncultured Vibrio sp.]OIQ26433.1 MAG: hypothetical protein BM561_01340 [Vibrio sp. MedPE-SWchi]